MRSHPVTRCSACPICSRSHRPRPSAWCATTGICDAATIFANGSPSAPGADRPAIRSLTGVTEPRSVLVEREEPDDPQQPHNGRLRLPDWKDRLRHSRRAYVASACLLAIAFVVLSIALGHHRREDPKMIGGDEPAHIDYALDLRNGHVPAWGDRLNQTTLRVVSCANEQTPASCRAGYRNPEAAGADGYSYEAQQPPLGYIPYALVATPARSPQQALVDLRRGGMIWTAAAGVVLLAFGLVEGLSLAALSVVLAVSLLSPEFFEWTATVTNDSAGAFAGGLGLLAVALSRRWKVPATLSTGVVVGIVLGLLKGLFIVVPAALAIEAIVMARPWRRAPDRLRNCWQSGACAFGMLAGTVVAYGGFVMLQDERSTVSPHVVLRALLGFAAINHVHLHTIIGSFSSLTTVFVPLFLPDSSSTVLYNIWNLAMMGTVLGAIVIRRQGDDPDPSRALGLGILGAIVALAVLWPLWWFLQGYDQITVARYVIPLCPLIGLVVVRATSTRVMAVIGLGLPLAAAAAQLGGLGY